MALVVQIWFVSLSVFVPVSDEPDEPVLSHLSLGTWPWHHTNDNKKTEAKQKLAVDPDITADTSLFMVLQKVFESLASALPQTWISFAADVSDMMAVRLGFVGGSEEIFDGNKQNVERFITLRSLYTVTLLRDLSSLKKTSFNAAVRLLVTSLQVDLDNALKLADAKAAEAVAAAEAAKQGISPEALKYSGKGINMPPKPHKVAALVPGFDVLQSTMTKHFVEWHQHHV